MVCPRGVLRHIAMGMDCYVVIWCIIRHTLAAEYMHIWYWYLLNRVASMFSQIISVGSSASSMTQILLPILARSFTPLLLKRPSFSSHRPYPARENSVKAFGERTRVRWTGSVCMVITYSRVWINWVRLPILLVVSWTGKIISPCPRACLRIWSRETGSAVPYRVSQLIPILRLNQ